MEALHDEKIKTINECHLQLITIIVYLGNYSFTEYEKQTCLCTQHMVIFG